MKIQVKRLQVIGALLFIQFYIIWTLGFINYVPQLYNYDILRASAILLAVGLLMMISKYLINIINNATRTSTSGH